MRKTLFGATTAAAFLTAVTLAPAAHAADKFEFADVTFSDGTTGMVQASTNVMKKKPDHVYCYFASPDWQPRGYYGAFIEPAPSSPEDVLAFCLANFDQRWQ